MKKLRESASGLEEFIGGKWVKYKPGVKPQAESFSESEGNPFYKLTSESVRARKIWEGLGLTEAEAQIACGEVADSMQQAGKLFGLNEAEQAEFSRLTKG